MQSIRFVLALGGATLVAALGLVGCSAPAGPRLQIAQANERSIPGLPYGDGIGLNGYVSTPSPEDSAITLNKRFVLRHPRRIDDWSGTMVIGAHGGEGGRRFDATGNEIGWDDTALDDIVGTFALEQGHAYASLDRNGHGGTREGDALVESFTHLMTAQVFKRLRREPDRILLVGFSMGGGIARLAAERESPYDGVLAIAGAGGDAVGQILRRIAIAGTWPAVDDTSAEAREERAMDRYAEAVGTPVEAQRLWPFIARSSSLDSARSMLQDAGYPAFDDDDLAALTRGRLAENEVAFRSLSEHAGAGDPKVPFIEIVGTFDDFVFPEIVAYRERVERTGASERHRLYRVHGAWHIDPEDDAVSSFQYVGSRMGLSNEAIEAMGTGSRYIHIARQSLVALNAWVAEGRPAPPGREFLDGESLLDSDSESSFDDDR